MHEGYQLVEVRGLVAEMTARRGSKHPTFDSKLFAPELLTAVSLEYSRFVFEKVGLFGE